MTSLERSEKFNTFLIFISSPTVVATGMSVYVSSLDEIKLIKNTELYNIPITHVP